MLGRLERVAVEEEDDDELEEVEEEDGKEEDEAAASNERVAACCDAGRACRRPLPFPLPIPPPPPRAALPLPLSPPFSSCLSRAWARCADCSCGVPSCIRASPSSLPSSFCSSPSASAATTSMSAGSPPNLACCCCSSFSLAFSLGPTTLSKRKARRRRASRSSRLRGGEEAAEEEEEVVGGNPWRATSRHCACNIMREGGLLPLPLLLLLPLPPLLLLLLVLLLARPDEEAALDVDRPRFKGSCCSRGGSCSSCWCWCCRVVRLAVLLAAMLERPPALRVARFFGGGPPPPPPLPPPPLPLAIVGGSQSVCGCVGRGSKNKNRVLHHGGEIFGREEREGGEEGGPKTARPHYHNHAAHSRGRRSTWHGQRWGGPTSMYCQATHPRSHFASLSLIRKRVR